MAEMDQPFNNRGHGLLAEMPVARLLWRNGLFETNILIVYEIIKPSVGMTGEEMRGYDPFRGFVTNHGTPWN